MFKAVWWEIESFLLPQSAAISRKIHHVKEVKVDDTLLKLTGLFVFVFLMVYILSVIITMYYYQNVPQVLFEVASAMSNVGLTTNLITASSPVIVKLTFIADMWTGRLEIWPILLLVAIGASNIIRK